jgi:thioredoxin-related protein
MGKFLILLIFFSFWVYGDSKQELDESAKAGIIKKEVHYNYQEALSAAKAENKNIFILFQAKGCRWCKKLKETTLKDPELLKRLNRSFVMLILDRESSSYPKKYKIEGVPTIYMISNKEEIYVRRVGYRQDPQEYIKWFNYIEIESDS